MDIRKWLDETAPPENHTHLQAAPITDSLRRLNGRENVPNGKHLPKRSRADSSLLEPSPPRRKTTTRQRELPTEGGTDESAHSEDPGGVPSEPSRYARRPRRKTRPHRYEPSQVADGRGKHVHRSREDESKKTRRKSKRKKEERLGSGIDFHAKNVSGDRLTLKPREQLGIFNKGRTSTAVKGRGLPDLVFSEMKFLQKHDEQSNLPREAAVTTKRRKKDHGHSREGEISAYFTGARPALVEKDGNLPDRRRAYGEEKVPTPIQREQGHRPVKDTAVPTTEAHDKASYLGFGNRGPRHESTSYVTWSESIRACSITPGRRLNRSSTHERQMNPPGRKTHGKSIDVHGASSTQSAHPSMSRVEGSDLTGQWKAPSADPSRHRVSRCHSFPQRTSCSRPVNTNNRAAKSPAADNSASPASMPPSLSAHVELSDARARDVNKLAKERRRVTYVPCSKQHSIHGQRRAASESGDMSDMAPSRSSDLDRTIQQCNEIFRQRSRATTTPHNSYPARHGPSHAARKAERQAHVDVDVTAHQTPRVRFAEIESRRPASANFAGPGMYEQQAQHEQVPRSCWGEHVLAAYDGEEENAKHDGNRASEEQAWEGADGHELDMGVYGADGHELDMGVYGADGHELDMGVYGADDGLAAETRVPHVASGDRVVAAGFWRPHRLY